MNPPDTNDTERALLVKIVAGQGGTVAATDDVRALIFALASLVITA